MSSSLNSTSLTGFIPEKTLDLIQFIIAIATPLIIFITGLVLYFTIRGSPPNKFRRFGYNGSHIEHENYIIRKKIAKIIFVMLFITSVISLLQGFGIDLTIISVILGTVFLAVSFASRDIILSIIAGWILYLEGKLPIGSEFYIIDKNIRGQLVGYDMFHCYIKKPNGGVQPPPKFVFNGHKSPEAPRKKEIYYIPHDVLWNTPFAIVKEDITPNKNFIQ